MALLSDNFKRRTTLGVGAGLGADEDEEEKISSLSRAAMAAEEEQRNKTSQPTEILRQADPATSLQRSIDKVGGSQVFSRRVNWIASYWRSMYGTDPDPAFVLDLARLPISLNEIKMGLTTGVKGFYRGLSSKTQTDEAQRWQDRGMIPTGRPNGTKARFMEDTAREEAASLENASITDASLPAGLQTNKGLLPEKIPYNPYWEATRRQVEDYKAKRYASQGLNKQTVAPKGFQFDSYVDMAVDGMLGRDQVKARDDGKDLFGNRPTAREKFMEDANQATLDVAVNAPPLTNPTFLSAAITAENMAMVKSAGVAQGVVLMTPEVAKAAEWVMNKAMSGLMWIDRQKDRYAIYTHGRMEYSWSGRPVSAETMAYYRKAESDEPSGRRTRTGKAGPRASADKQIRLGEFARVYNPDGTEMWLTATAGMTKEQFLKVLELRGTQYTVDGDKITIQALGDTDQKPMVSADFLQLGRLVDEDNPANQYADWLTEGKLSMGETFVSGGLKEIGFIEPPREGETSWSAARFAGLLGDMLFYGMGDAAIGGGIRVALDASQVDRLARWGVHKAGIIPTISERVANTSSITEIMELTGIHSEEAAKAFVPLSTVDAVSKQMTTVLADGFRIDPMDFMLKRQLKFAVASSDSYQNMPKLFKMAFQVGPESNNTLRIGDGWIHESVRHIADAFNVDRASYLRWSDKILMEADPNTRAGYMTKMWEEWAKLDPATYKRALTRMDKYAVKTGNPVDHLLRTWAPDPEVFGKEISVRDTAAELTKLQNKMARVEEQVTALRQMELQIPESLAEREAAGLLGADELSIARQRLEGAQKFYDSFGKELEETVAEVTSEKSIWGRAKNARDVDLVRATDIRAKQALHDLGGWDWPSDWDSQLPWREKARLMNGLWSPNKSMSLWKRVKASPLQQGLGFGGRINKVSISSADDIAGQFATQFPDLAMSTGIHDSDSLLEFLKRTADLTSTKQVPISNYVKAAEKEAWQELRSGHPGLDDDLVLVEEAKKTIAELRTALSRHYDAAVFGTGSTQPFSLPAEAPGMLSASKRQQTIERLTARLSGMQSEFDTITQMGTSRVPVPLWLYQQRQYWSPPVALDLLAAETAGPVSRAMDSLSRGLVTTKSTLAKRGMAAGGATVAGGVASNIATAEGAGPEATWAARITAAMLGGLAGYKVGMKWAKVLEHPDAWVKYTPNLDYATSLWKRYALGSVGVLFRVAGDEPARMASRGYGFNAMFAWFSDSPIQREMLEQGWYMGPYSYEKGLTQLAYLMNNTHPTSFVSYRPIDRGWEKAFRTSTKIIQSQPTTRVFVQAIRSGEDPKVAIMRWFDAHPDTAKMMVSHRGTSLETLVDQEVEYLTKFTHKRVAGRDPLGVLTPRQKSEWEAYQQALRGDPAAAAPAWFNKVADRIITEGESGDLIHLRRQAQLFGFLSGDEMLNPANIKKLSLADRPIISARRAKGSVAMGDGMVGAVPKAMSLVDGMYDTLYGRFDAIMRNVRSNIYLREYKNEVEGLRRLAAERTAAGVPVATDETTLHMLADRKAQSMVDTMTYTASRTGLETMLRNVVPFMPATRDFLTFWAAESIRRPTRLAAFMRLNTMLPEDVEVQWDEDTLFGLGRILEGITQSNSMSFNPRALTFFTGGATSPQNTGSNFAWSFAESQFPGFGPTVTMPAHYLATSDPENFGLWPSFWGIENKDLTKIPGMSLVKNNIPLFSRTERFVWAAAALVGAVTGSKAQGYDFAQSMLADIPWLGRDREARDRMVDLEIQWIMQEEGMKETDLGSLTMEEKNVLLEKAKARIVTREGATGFMGFVLPAIPYFHEREGEDMRKALTAYRDTYNTWARPAENEVETVGPGWQEASRKQAQADQRQLRADYSEYSALFDYVDALAQGDEDKMYEVGAAHPEVIAYFVQIHNDLADAADTVSLEDYDDGGWEGWQVSRALGYKPVKYPAAYLGEMADKMAKAAEYNQARDTMTSFEQMMAASGYKEGDLEYESAKDTTLAAISTGAMRQNPLEPYMRLGWKTPLQLGMATDPAEDAWKKEKAALLRAEMDTHLEDALTDQAKAAIKQQYRDIFTEEGLDMKILSSGGAEFLPATVAREREMLADVSKDPWGFSKDEIISHNLQWNDSLPTMKVQVLEAKEQLQAMVKKYGGNGASIWDKKFDTIRASYQEYVRQLCDSDDAFATFWDYYQAEPWEKMQDTGRYQSESWQAWFDALAQRDYLVDKKIDTGICDMNKPAKKVEKLVAALWAFADQLKANDPKFAEEFDLISKSFWRKERRW
jgi:hypothetical protein